MSSYKKGSRGLSVLPRVHCIFTASSISLSLGWRQPGHHYAIRAGRNLPDKEFRYLRTVIVTAAVYRGFDQELRSALTPSINLPAPGRRHAHVTFVFAQCCVFNKQLSAAGILPLISAPRASRFTYVSACLLPSYAPFCLVPSPEFSQAPWNPLT